jgi:pimeloyl-ACP methyl ester carboxylesterase
VVLAHGAVVNGWEMGLLRWRLKQAGFGVRQFYYRSMVLGFEENVARLGTFLSRVDADVLHVIGHSMGGVLIRELFERRTDPRPGRLIAIGSPLTDCLVGRRIARLHAHFGPYLVGRTVHEFLDRPSNPKWRGERDLGVMAGTFPLGIGRIFRELPGPSDGVVLLEETRLQGLADHVTFRLNHFGMLLSQRCAVEMVRFLATGRFAHPEG